MGDFEHPKVVNISQKPPEILSEAEKHIQNLQGQIERLWGQIQEKDAQINQLQHLCATAQKSIRRLIEQNRLLLVSSQQSGMQDSHSHTGSRSNRHSSREPTYEKTVVCSLVNTHFPDWSIRELRFCGQGSSFCTYTLNQDYIIRCARHRDSVRRLRWEERLLPKLQPQLQISIPQFQHVGYMSNGLPFCIYPMISGQPFEEKYYHRLSEVQRENVVQQVAAFLKVLHNFPIEEAITYSIPFREITEYPVRDMLQFVRQKLHPKLSLAEQQQCQRWFDIYINNERDFSYQPSLIHGDLQPRHILFNEEKGEIVGIIDFEDIRVSDPAHDLYYMYRNYGDDFWHRLLQHYSPHNLKYCQWKFRFSRLVDIIQHLLENIEDRRFNNIEEGLEELQEFLNRHNPDEIERSSMKSHQ